MELLLQVLRRLSKNNNLTNSVKAGTEGGWGIWNKVSSSLSVIAENNYCFNNIAGNYSSVAPLSQATSPISVKLPGSGTTDPDIPPYALTPGYIFLLFSGFFQMRKTLIIIFQAGRRI